MTTMSFHRYQKKVRKQLWNLDGVKKKESYITEGAYVLSVISRDGIRPLEEDTLSGKQCRICGKKSVLIMLPGQR